jgi:hypothetical protein
VVADRVALLHDGRVCRVGGVDVLERPGDAACARLLGFARVPLAAGAVAARPGDIAVGRADELLPDGHLAVAGELGRVLEFGGEVRVRVEVAGEAVDASLPAPAPSWLALAPAGTPVVLAIDAARVVPLTEAAGPGPAMVEAAGG